MEEQAKQAIVRFYGTRGSISSASSEDRGFITTKYGGETTSIEFMADELICLDAGSGMRLLGKSLAERGFRTEKKDIHVPLTHYHTDHIAGLPFLRQIHDPDAIIRIYGPKLRNSSVEDSIRGFIGGVYFPGRIEIAPSPVSFDPYFRIKTNVCGAKIYFEEVTDGQKFRIGNSEIEAAIVAHSDSGSSIYKIKYEGKTLVFATDTEVNADEKTREKILRLSDNADLLVIDGQYTASEYAARKGWGHNDLETALKIGIDAKVKKLIITHHDPEHDDSMLSRLEEECRKSAAELSNKTMDIAFAYEGLKFGL